VQAQKYFPSLEKDTLSAPFQVPSTKVEILRKIGLAFAKN